MTLWQIVVNIIAVVALVLIAPIFFVVSFLGDVIGSKREKP